MCHRFTASTFLGSELPSAELSVSGFQVQFQVRPLAPHASLAHAQAFLVLLLLGPSLDMGFASVAISPVAGGFKCCTCQRQCRPANLRGAAEVAIFWPSERASFHKKRGGHWGPAVRSRRRFDVAAKVGESDVSPQNGAPAGGPEENDMAERLAKAEAEAAALRKELESRKAVVGADLGKPRPGNKRIDGTGLREVLWEGPGAQKERAKFSKSAKSAKWGLSEAELFISRGAGEGEMEAIVGPATDEGAENVVRRNLIIGVALAVVAGVLAFVRFPGGRPQPSKPLFFYLVPLVRIQGLLPQLQLAIEEGRLADLREQLKTIVGEPNNLKDNLLNAASWLPTDAELDAANQVAFDVLEYVDQADSKKYFDNFGEPSAAQRSEFSKFSLQSIKAASRKLDEFFKLMPSEDVAAAKEQVLRTSLPEEQLTI
ncbi:hypothetical protein KFL_003480060 [Klebsormidium nitens]|uniref:Uncharacterized protein n=1 Tax=Klebsormidium nitens TaxID=105231 RepID=A0A1Y1IBL8_KLENI|nr:hypothetical protein KFL_003480060 [Klebsormidium nitens]|eukprot:GAQ87362.1 hypothetical protein KFL_003480060 [Klebsormidium nitens]